MVFLKKIKFLSYAGFGRNQPENINFFTVFIKKNPF